MSTIALASYPSDPVVASQSPNRLPKALFRRAARSHLATLLADLEGKAQSDRALLPFVRRLAAVRTKAVQRGPLPLLDHPGAVDLSRTLDALADDHAIAPATRTAAALVDWGALYGGDAHGGLVSEVRDGMFAAQIAGTYGIFRARRVATGFFFIRPGVHYPLHTHQSSEIYYCLSGRLTIQHGTDGAPFDLNPGEYSVTPSHRLHALTTHDEPVLLVYVWHGDLAAPIWLWEQNDQPGWTRTSWKRTPGQPWVADAQEEVSAEDMMAQR